MPKAAPPGLAPAATPAKPAEPAEPKTREELKRALFLRLDTSNDGRLGADELLPFVLKTGFDGTPEEWKEEYTLLCKDMGCNTQAGLDADNFSSMLDDDSDEGCYCDDAELRSVLSQLPAPTPEAGGRPAAARPAPPPPRPTHREVREELPPPQPADPWAAPAVQDPWSAAVQDPWAAPAAKAASKGKKGKGKGKAKDAPPPSREQAEASDAPGQDDNWGAWRDAGKLGPEHDPSRPALNAQKLLEASRAALAAKKAREVEEAEAEAAEIAAAALRSAEGGGGEGDEDDGGDFWEVDAPAHPSSGSRSSNARATKAASMSETFGEIGMAMCQLATGESRAVGDLVRAVMRAPSMAHALAVASSAIRSILQGRLSDAQTLLGVDELLFIPVNGDTAVLLGLAELARALGVQAAPFLNKAMLPALVKVDDKSRSVSSAAEAATREIVGCNSRFAFEAFLPALTAALDPKRSPAMKVHAMRLLAECWGGSDGEAAVSHRLPQLLPAIVSLLVDTASDVRSAAVDTAEVLFGLCGNRDLRPFYGDILACAKGTKGVDKCVRELAEVVFVQQVQASALAVVLPVLVKALRTRNLRTQRQACVIAKNMCELVSAVADVTPFTPQLLPLLERVHEDASDPDVRAVAGRARGSLEQAADIDVVGSVRQELRAALQEALDGAPEKASRDGDVLAPCPGPVRSVIQDYVVMLAVSLGQCCLRERSAWASRLLPLLEPLLSVGDGRQLVGQLHEIGSRLSSLMGDDEGEADKRRSGGSSAEGGEPLCDCTFTLACGAATLLVGARLRLERGRVYGLVGANDSGKSTILRAIHDRRVSDFPPMKEVVTALVEHGVGEKPPDCDRTPVEYLLADSMIQALKLTRQEVTRALTDWGFKQEGRMQRPIGTLSGGWRMKLGLARAMLQNADVLLLDEPTGHLDAAHISWLVDYVQGLRRNPERAVTALVVSHDTKFLDRVCTDIIHADGGKLHAHPGNFSKFIELVPDARLGTGPTEEGVEKALAAFSLPEPGPLEGVRSRSRRFLNLEDVFFSYEKGSIPVIRGASVECCLKSRVAIVGPNGAGKSTLAALVVGELAPDRGVAWRHPALRTAFVAQHAFHHLERHMDLTATQYILWRFEGNEDREAMEMRADEAETEDPRPYRLEGSRLVACQPGEEEDAARPDVILDRRQRGRLGYEYEVRLQGHQETLWVHRAQLAAMGCLGMATREDERQAAQRSLAARPLTTPGVEAHLAGFGLEAEEASHRRLGALSHGQRARAVLAAATWLAPHLLVLDEPTNYLDGPALKALVAGLQGFGGGVLVISHTASFLDEVCAEKWHMSDGVLRLEGPLSDSEEAVAAAAAAEGAAAPPPRPARKAAVAGGAAAGGGGAGFEASLEAAKAAAKEQREKKRLKRLKELRRKNGEQVSSSDDDEWYQDLLRKANARPKAAGS